MKPLHTVEKIVAREDRSHSGKSIDRLRVEGGWLYILVVEVNSSNGRSITSSMELVLDKEPHDH